MQPSKSLDDLKHHVRLLVVEYATNGKDALNEMSESDRRLLLSEKQLQFAQVSERCAKGESLEVNAPLKTMLECDVKEIGESIESQRRIERGR